MSEVKTMQLSQVKMGSIVFIHDDVSPAMLVSSDQFSDIYIVRRLFDGVEYSSSDFCVDVLWEPGCPPTAIPLSPSGIEVVVIPVDHLAYLATVAFREMITKKESYMQCLSEYPMGKICFVDDQNLTFRLFDHNAFRLEIATFKLYFASDQPKLTP